MKGIFKKIIISILAIGFLLAPVAQSLSLNFASANTNITIEEVTLNNTVATFKVTINETKTNYMGGSADYSLYEKTWKDEKPATVNPFKAGKIKVEENKNTQSASLAFDSLTPKTNYYLSVSLKEEITQDPVSGEIINYGNNFLTHVEFRTYSEENSGDGATSNSTQNVDSGNPDSPTSPPNTLDLNCSIFTNIGGCVAEIFYLLWSATSNVAILGGHFLDFFVYYSTNSDSYSNIFIEKAWGTIRDVANIFFIITLLYIALKTVLGLNVSNNKKMIGTVIIIALIINFSLFTSRVVIDASNILAKIFYNNITSVDSATQQVANAGSEGQKSISVGLVSKFDPQKLLTTSTYKQMGIGMFIFLILLLMAITLYMAYVFFSVALLFVGRVVSLWLAMIFSPLAFISYAVPFEMPFGHKEWWKNLLENAFLAPIFIFFLYIVIQFTDFIKDAVKYSANEADTMQSIMGVVIPFAVIFMLLYQAKKLALKYAGEMGAMINKAGAAVGGLALGAVTGGAGLAMSGTLGKLGGSLAGSQKLKDMSLETGMTGWASRMALKASNKASKSSFDLRKSPVGALVGKAGLDLNKAKMIGLGTDKTAGGFKGAVERKEKKIEEGYKMYETKKSDAEVDKMTGGEHKTAAEYNLAMKEKYSNIIGKGLVYSLADSTIRNTQNIKDKDVEKAKQEYASKDQKYKDTHPEPTKESIIEERIKKLNLGLNITLGGLGAVAAVATGGVAGGAVFGALGGSTAVGTGIGAAIGGGMATNKGLTDSGALAGAKKKFEKEIKKGQKQIKELKRVEEERENLENLVGEMDKEKNNYNTGKTPDKQLNIRDYIRKQIIETEEELDSIKEEVTQIRDERRKLQGILDTMPQKSGIVNPERSKIVNRIDQLNQKEDTQKGKTVNAKIKQFDYKSAKDAQEKLANLRNREDSLGEKISPKKEEKMQSPTTKPPPKSEGGKTK
ncbi:MAG TPA: hypothetical protein VFQ59_01130 [Candidatus Paceibacterota bacterium]|nr:hypothetical protein [Candidatus Paceibacterota bacterium]